MFSTPTKLIGREMVSLVGCALYRAKNTPYTVRGRENSGYNPKFWGGAFCIISVPRSHASLTNTLEPFTTSTQQQNLHKSSGRLSPKKRAPS